MFLFLLVCLLGVSTVINGIVSSSGSMLRDTPTGHKEESLNTGQQVITDINKKQRNALQQKETLPINEERKKPTTSDNLQLQIMEMALSSTFFTYLKLEGAQ